MRKYFRRWHVLGKVEDHPCRPACGGWTRFAKHARASCRFQLSCGNKLSSCADLKEWQNVNFKRQKIDIFGNLFDSFSTVTVFLHRLTDLTFKTFDVLLGDPIDRSKAANQPKLLSLVPCIYPDLPHQYNCRSSPAGLLRYLLL